MPRMRVTNTHGLGIGKIAELAAHAEKPCVRQKFTAVVRTRQGIPAETIAQTRGCSRVSVWRYVSRWNKQGMEAAGSGSAGRGLSN
ncbi:MAG: helix-turn-helix domain-containing protein [Firmicutes bacterium]|nr:helix-turn-helix domain-containing protein [Bacillota bacterium]